MFSPAASDHPPPKYRKPGTGGIYQLNDHLGEGKYSPRDAQSKHIPRNVYAHTHEKCEAKLATMIEKTSTEIAAEKERLELQKLPNPYRRNCTAINKETVYPNILQRRTQIMNPLTSLRNQRVHQIRK